MDDTTAFTGLFGAGLAVTAAGQRRACVAADATATHVLLLDWDPPPGGDGSVTDPSWVPVDTISSVEPWKVSAEDVAAAPAPPDLRGQPDRQADPNAVIYP